MFLLVLWSVVRGPVVMWSSSLSSTFGVRCSVFNSLWSVVPSSHSWLRFRIPDCHYISRALRPHSVVAQNIFGGAGHFGPGKDNRFTTASGIELEGDEFIFQIAQDLDQVSQVLNRLMIDRF